MTLKEAIRHAEEKAKCGGRCGEEHAQLAEWLKELRERRTAESEKRTEERTKTHACDCISRRAAIKEAFPVRCEGDVYMMVQVETLEGLPSVESDLSEYSDKLWKTAYERGKAEALAERKTGKWIPVMNGRGGHCCNRCNGYAPSYMNGDEHLSDFCHNCGAYMGATGGENDV